MRSAYNKKVLERIALLWDENMSAVEKWDVLHDGLVDAGSELLGRDCRRQPDWYKDSFDILQPLITSRNALFARWLQCKGHRIRQRYVDMRRTVTAAVRKAKNDWFQQKAKEIESKVQAGVIGDAWKCVRDIQRGRAGLHPTKPKAVRNLNGDLCSTPAESLQRWQQHFNSVLNTSGISSLDLVDSFPSCDVHDDLDVVLSLDEVRNALSLVAGNKAGGRSGILPEMVNVCSDDLLKYLLDLFTSVWDAGCVPQEWRDASLVPVPKKGDLSLCDNWRGISLLDVVGKVLAKVIQQCLQTIVEEEVADSQCCFRCNRGCNDMIFCARQLIEKAVEHYTNAFLLFVDLRKAYDSVPKEAMWMILSKYGIPEKLISIVRSFHDNMQAGISINDGCCSCHCV